MNAKNLAYRAREYLNAQSLLDLHRASDADVNEEAMSLAVMRNSILAATESPNDEPQSPLTLAVRDYLLVECDFEQYRVEGRDLERTARKAERMRAALEGQLVAGVSGAPTDKQAVESTSSQVSRIVIAIDKSEQADWAIEVGSRLASKISGQILLLHVVQPEIGIAEDFVTGQSLDSIHSKEGKELLDEVMRCLAPALGARQMLRYGHASDEIVAAAEEWGADMIVLGTHGRGRVAQFFLGSTADEVIRRAHCPVLTIGHEPRFEKSELPNYSRRVESRSNLMAAFGRG